MLDDLSNDLLHCVVNCVSDTDSEGLCAMRCVSKRIREFAMSHVLRFDARTMYKFKMKTLPGSAETTDIVVISEFRRADGGLRYSSSEEESKSHVPRRSTIKINKNNAETIMVAFVLPERRFRKRAILVRRDKCSLYTGPSIFPNVSDETPCMAPDKKKMDSNHLFSYALLGF